MKRRAMGAFITAVLSFAAVGCSRLPGKPGFRPETLRPDQTHDFAVLYQRNCSACHGDHGRGGAAFPLDNAVYLAWAGHDRMIQIVSNGVPDGLMPAFAQSGGGLLTGRQVEEIVSGMISHWGKADTLNGASAPGYTASSNGDAEQGQAAFQTYCARCHGANGEGGSSGKNSVTGSIVDPTYVSLISNQGLRDIVVSGLPGENMPDWRGDVAGKAMTDKEATDIVAWMTSHRPRPSGRPLPAMQEKKQQQTVKGGTPSRQQTEGRSIR
jgi:mono/diheme cytochrome c family protein